MRTMDWPRVFSLLAHELRSPAAVIGGYARMLSEGRLRDDDRLQAYSQIERAAHRVTSIGQQASDLSRWLRPTVDGTSAIDLPALIADALDRVAAPERVIIDDSIESCDLKIAALDRDALSAALAAAIDAVCRESADSIISIAARADADGSGCDILIGPTDVVFGLRDQATAGAAPSTMPAEREGLGLALVLSAVVLLAHGGQLSTVGDRRDVIALRLRTDKEVD